MSPICPVMATDNCSSGNMIAVSMKMEVLYENEAHPQTVDRQTVSVVTPSLFPDVDACSCHVNVLTAFRK